MHLTSQFLKMSFIDPSPFFCDLIPSLNFPHLAMHIECKRAIVGSLSSTMATGTSVGFRMWQYILAHDNRIHVEQPLPKYTLKPTAFDINDLKLRL